MAQSKKRRHSVSPERNQQPQDRKKRKINNSVLNQTSIAGPSRPRVERSPVPLPSDSSTTLDGDSTPSNEKGKGKAVEKDPIMLELEQLRKEVAHKNELLENNKKTATALLQALSCHVCLETMSIPYALACGHMACKTCLVRWFTSTKNEQNNDAEDPEIDWYSDEESDIEADGPNPEAGPVPNGHDNAIQNLNGNGDVPQAAPAAPVLDALTRRKTCPHCRCVIKQRPIQIYPVKDIIGILVPGTEQELQASPKQVPKGTAAADPWKGIFPSVPGHNARGNDDDAPGPGFGGMPNILHPALPAPSPDFEDEQFSDGFVPVGNLVPPPPPPPLPQPLIDEEDGVHRCGVCLHEIWDGACTNDHCNAIYDDHDPNGDLSDDSDDGVDIMPGGNFFYGDGEDEGEPQGHHSDAVDGDVEDGYESSFIDDGDDQPGLFRRLHRRFWPRIQEGTSSDVEVIDDDDFVPGPSRRYSRVRQDSIVISSSEDELIDRRGRTLRYIDVDEEDAEEQEVEGDVRSVSERSFPTNDIISEHQFTEPSGVHYIEEDDEYYGNEEVPYVWDEDDEDSGMKEPDNVVYLRDEEQDEGYES